MNHKVSSNPKICVIGFSWGQLNFVGNLKCVFKTS